MFQKAKPEQAKLKIATYGPAGSGKTLTAMLFAEGLMKLEKKLIAIVDTERGTDFYATKIKERTLHPEEFEFDAIYTRSLSKTLNDCKKLDPDKYGVIIIDSMSHMWEAAIDAYKGKRTKIGTIPLHAWPIIKKPYKTLVDFLIESPFHVFILGRQKNVFADDPETEEMKQIGVTMRAEGETPYEPHICARMECIKNKHNTVQSKYHFYIEKDRTGILGGRTIVNPTFKTIEPLLQILGDKQAKHEDETERVICDAELMTKMEKEQENAQENKSEKMYNDVLEKLKGIEDLKTLSQLGAKINENKKYLTETHGNVLRKKYKQKKDELVSTTVSDI